MKILHRKSFKWSALMILTVTLSCNKLIDADMPIGSSDTEKTFSTTEGAKTAVRGMYSFLSGHVMLPHTALPIFMGMYADEMVRTSYTERVKTFVDNQIDATNSIPEFWDHPYNLIYQANNVIEKVALSQGIPSAKKNSLIAEGKFLRALMYFHMVNLYADIPLLTTADYTKNTNVSRASVEDVYALILEDLTFAKANLDDEFLSPSLRNRATTYAASALLARVHLYLKQYKEAEQEATAVIDSRLYALEPLSNVFLHGSKETILCLSNWLNLPQTSASSFSGSNLENTEMRLSEHILDLFEPNDRRHDEWLRAGIGSGAGSFAPFKFKIYFATDAAGKIEHKQILRYAEVLLIRAEARNEQDKKAQAIADLDLVRQRAGIDLIVVSNPTISQEHLRELLFKERATELFAENGHRWFDLKRRGDAFVVEYMKKVKPDFQPYALLLPIPNSERIKNPNLKQNEGYN